LLKDINDQKEHAIELANVLKGLNVYVNLIPYNEIVEVSYKKSSTETLKNFQQTLIDNKINAIFRQELGSDIDAACGQLRSKTVKGERV
jgi:23S rRNA (adenine2503-C2)-methyltransferase